MIVCVHLVRWILNYANQCSKTGIASSDYAERGIALWIVWQHRARLSGDYVDFATVQPEAPLSRPFPRSSKQSETS
jgi:hypothetical protein